MLAFYFACTGPAVAAAVARPISQPEYLDAGAYWEQARVLQTRALTLIKEQVYMHCSGSTRHAAAATSSSSNASPSPPPQSHVIHLCGITVSAVW